jgi:outer membrane protein OmpA-like peptidoglycan-associated protein
VSALRRLGLLLLGLPALSGCVGSYVALQPDAHGRVGSLDVQSGDRLIRLDAPNQALVLAPHTRPFIASGPMLQGNFAAALAARPPEPERFLIRFEGNGWRLTPASLAALDEAVQAARQREYPRVAVIGHTDRLGEKSVNFQVGLQRARRVAELLAERGLQAVELQIGSHGELDPLVPTADATAEPRNRRVEILVR